MKLDVMSVYVAVVSCDYWETSVEVGCWWETTVGGWKRRCMKEGENGKEGGRAGPFIQGLEGRTISQILEMK